MRQASHPRTGRSPERNVLFSLRNIRRAPGLAGTLRQFSEIVHETQTDSFIQRNGTVSPWPGSMNVVWDA
ncbi:hypothetical protein GALMADRAFT_731932 [Galerina marginata CBS 339.88]|uniref:Uncharacterized protein n=1 Tax=Galerina marginata (strain CBS 339.88) TaxID=685588 RepID=A0A067T312_GALM3|nr:hypothetical protein GALMADRAFT_731932 [Galerina marginata CBS 339.88]